MTLDAQANGEISASFDGYSLPLGRLSTQAARQALKLRKALPLNALTSRDGKIGEDFVHLVQRLARNGLLEYRLGARDGADLVVIEPQVQDYWPQVPKLGDADTLVLSRFAYLHRRDDAMVIEAPHAGALFKIYDFEIAAFIAALSTPQQIKVLRRQKGFPGLQFLGLLVDCGIVSKTDGKSEKDKALVLWDFHDLLFHARSTQGRHANAVGGTYPHAGTISPLPALRPRWIGKAINLNGVAASADQETSSSLAKLLRTRHSTRSFDDRRPITLAELARFLDQTARVLAMAEAMPSLNANLSSADFYTVRPYPSAGASYALELYLAVNLCEGLERGFYHYDAGAHALVPIEVGAQEFEALMAGAQQAMSTRGAPQVLITMAARFGRMSWKYSSIAYSLILKDVGVLTQTFYLAATDMGLGGCAIGIVNIDLFAKMTKTAFHVEGPVGQFALGRGRGTYNLGVSSLGGDPPPTK